MKIFCKLITSTVLALSLGRNFVSSTSDDSYEYIVVGTGAAGSIVSSRLAESGAKVLVLEAGGDNSDPAVTSMTGYYNVAFNTFNYGFLNWAFTTTEQAIATTSSAEPSVFSLAAGRLLGGSASINAGAYVMGHRQDFDLIAEELGDDDWSWDSVVPYFEDTRKTLGIVSLNADNQAGAHEYLDSLAKLGYNYNPECDSGKQNGVCPTGWTGSLGSSGGLRKSSYSGYLQPLVNNDNVDITVLTYHEVTNILFEDPQNSTKAIGVTALNRRANSASNFTATKEVIVCGGAYLSPKILLASGVGPTRELESVGVASLALDAKGVGKNLRDHYSVAAFWPLLNLTAEAPYLFNSPVFNLFGPEAEDQTSYQFELAGGYGAVVPLRASSVGEIRLASVDPNDPPLINPNVVSNDDDFQNLVKGLSEVLLPLYDDLIEKGLVGPGGLDTKASLDEIEEYVQANIASSYHAVGTCKVGTENDDMAVVDHEFKVIGTSNLRVVDASVFPKVPSGNTQAQTMALAHLGAAKILRTTSKEKGGGQTDEKKQKSGSQGKKSNRPTHPANKKNKKKTASSKKGKKISKLRTRS